MLSRRRPKQNGKAAVGSQNQTNQTPLRSNAKPTVNPAPRESQSTDTTIAPDTMPSSPQHLAIPAIYAAPTVDTLDDESLFRGRAQHWGGNVGLSPEAEPQSDDQSGVTRHHVSFSPTNNNYSYHHTAHSPTRSRVEHPELPSAEKSPQKRKRKPRDFQHKEDFMHCLVRKVNVVQRSAFAVNKPVSIEEWYVAAQRIDSKNKSPLNGTVSSSASAHKKLSPSLQLLKLLHSMQSLDTIRQLSFTGSPSSDVFQEALATRNTESGNSANINKQTKLKRRSSSVGEQRDGRYHSIHPVQATLSTLPTAPPCLSNKKLRRPMRSDVGFPNATEEEIRQKQAEINRETEWEEASPRLIVLVTSDDLGTAVQEETSDSFIHSDHREWNGGGLQGMPWAGRELLRAKELNALHFSRKTGDGKEENTVKHRFLEPNRESFLAPPLDASYSKTLGWRPRPFHDRQPGMEYLLSWPLHVSFDTGNSEPLVCSLALYNLPTNELAGSSSSGVYGKISEEFWFPAGDWDGKIELDPSCLRVPSGSGPESTTTKLNEAELVESWSKRKQKAIFSYDPLVIKGGKKSLCWVLQIYELGNDALLKDPLSSNKRGSSVKKLFKAKPSSTEGSGTHVYESTNGDHTATNTFYDTFGTKLMTPLGFGVQPILDHEQNTKHVFPTGHLQEMKLWAAPPVPESQEDFVLRLQRITKSDGASEETWQQFAEVGLVQDSSSHFQSEISQTSDVSGAFDLASVVSTASERSVPNHVSSCSSTERNSFRSSDTHKTSPPTRKKKSLKQRMWISPAKATRSLKTSSQSIQKAVQTATFRSNNHPGGSGAAGKQINAPLAATASVFSSTLSTDWLETMLKEPTDMHGFKLKQPRQIGTQTVMPKLLCDVSGDFAVMLEEPGVGKRRSNLIRSQSHTQPAGYATASEIREVLFLPARAEKQYDVDIPPSLKSLLNLLYLFPRLLRASPDQQNNSSKQKKEDHQRYTVRVRLVRSSLAVDTTGTIATSQKTLEAFHSASPWTGSPLVREVFTRIPSSQRPSKVQKDTTGEQPMRDEFKLRLPAILDGTYFLQFSLFVLEPDCTLRAVAENSIPLSSSAGSKVATCIPNGCHRVKLGDFRFYIESRLVSSIHIADAAVAAAIRDFPLVFQGQSARNRGDVVGGIGFMPGITEGAASSSNASSPALFANASGGTVVGHFQLLLYLHLSTLLGPGDTTGATHQTEMTSDLMMGTLRSLFEIFRKVKLRLTKRLALASFLKAAVDEFEEGFLVLPGNSAHHRSDEQSSDLGSDEMNLGEAHAGSTAGKDNIIEDDEEDQRDFLDEGAVRLRKDSLRTGISRRLSRRASMGIGDSSGKRVAYGPSNLDRMKLEAELYYESGRFSHLFEDDDTIVTSGTSLHNFSDVKQKQEAPGQTRNKVWAVDQNDVYSESSIKAATAAASRIANKASEASPSPDEGFATRVKSVASVMLAPCVGKTGSSGSPRRLSLDCGRSRRRRRNSSNKAGTAPTASSAKVKKGEVDTCVLPGSDEEDEGEEESKSRREPMYTWFRGRLGQPLTFTAMGRCLEDATCVVSGGKYVYESILVLWLQVWLEQLESQGDTIGFPAFDSPATSTMLLDFFNHKDVLLPLILKSIALRHGAVLHDNPMALLDTAHMSVLKQFVEMLAKCLLSQALAESNNSTSAANNHNLLKALESTDCIVDFFEGLASVLHSEHVRSLLERFFSTLRTSESELSKENAPDFEWTPQRIHRVKSSRQIRLRACEKLAVISFLPLNFPTRFGPSPTTSPGNDGDSTWKMQYNKSGSEAATEYTVSAFQSNDARLPRSGWLSKLLTDEALSICALSCEAVVAEAIAHIEFAQRAPLGKQGETQKKKRQLERTDLLLFQSLAIHSVTVVYELVMRRHAMDRRFQTESCRERIAALYAECVFSHSEAPEVLIRAIVRSYCDPSNLLIHRFIRLLRLGSSTFQSFVDQSRHSTFPNEIDESISPWLLQESFNTILNATNIVVEECVKLTEPHPWEQKKMIHSILDLFLHILTTPQSSVTHLRALGGALQALEQFGISIFLSAVGNTLQHWLRIILSLMNSTSLSVRSISVDFVLSLLGNAFDLLGSVDDILMVFVSVLPEVVGREIGLFSVDGHVQSSEDLEKCIWPMRRSFADLEDADPLDDDRIDPELSPILRMLCRASQAVLDGVLIELRLGDTQIVGTQIEKKSDAAVAFDADEESLVEAANFFLPETGPMQRIRWLRTLKALHEAKGQWLEAAEALMDCASTISDAITHLDNVWRPSTFLLWSDKRRSTWLQTVGEEMGRPDRGNAAVVAFSNELLEPSSLLGRKHGSLPETALTMATMCRMLTSVTKEAVQLYLREGGMEELAYFRLEALLKILMGVLSDQGSLREENRRTPRLVSAESMTLQVEKEGLLRRVTATLSGLLVGLLVDEESATATDRILLPSVAGKDPFYLLVSVSGVKPQRFQESTTLPTFLDWSMPCVCRVSQQQVDLARKKHGGDFEKLNKQICWEFGRVLKVAFERDMPSGSVEVCTGNSNAGTRDPDKTYIDLTVLRTDIDTMVDHSRLDVTPSRGHLLETKRFFYRKPVRLNPPSDGIGLPPTPVVLSGTIVEVTVAYAFPSKLSRQRVLLTSEIRGI